MSNQPATLGRYSIVASLGSGSLVQRYHARSPEGRDVALLNVLPQFADDPVLMKLFWDDANALSRLHHPNVARQLASEREEACLVMEYIDGVGLDRVMPVAPFTAAWIITEACAGLHAAHELGCVHRDVKPSNIMLGRDGATKVIDFPLAKAASATVRMACGKRLDDFRFFSPEQCLGQALDRRTDIWSLGIVLYEVITDRRLFPHEDDLQLLKAISGPAPLPHLDSSLPPTLEPIIRKALERHVDARYQTALELRDTLLNAIGRSDRSDDVAALVASRTR